MTPLQIIILAAGASTRMRGADKLLEVLDGVVQIRRITQAALATGAPVTVALPPDRPLRDAALTGLAVTRLTIADAATGLSASIRAANAVVPSGPVMLVLADLPDLTSEDLRQMQSAFGADTTRILRATSAGGTPGHPVILPDWVRPELAKLAGDTGAAAILKRHAPQVRQIALPDRHATTDLDTPEDWAAFRASTGQ